jgi:hypothetical protein
LSPARPETYSIEVATVESAPQTADAVILEAHRGHRAILLTLNYAAIRQIREALESPTTEHSGLLYGTFTADAIAIQAASQEKPIGIFRAQPGGWPALTEADRKKMRGPLPSGGLLLVIRTLAQRPWAATLYAVDFFQPAASETPLIEFPFDEYLLRNGWLTDLAPSPPPAAPLVPHPRPRRPKLVWAAAALTALLLGGVAAYRWLPSSLFASAGPPDRADSSPSESPLGLKVTRSFDDLELSWNRASDAVRLAAAGTLTIRNGTVLRTIEVTPEQLREGHVVYHPLSGVDLDARLEVMAPDGKREAESVQFLGFDTSPSLTVPVPPPATPRPPARTPPRQNADRRERNASSARSPATNAEHSEPVPIHRVNPDLSREVLGEMRAAKGKVSVSVLVSVDSSGTVQGVKVVSSTGEPSPSGPYIRLSALNAARQWKFRPAIAGGKPVASQMTLVFNY